jgi:flagellin
MSTRINTNTTAMMASNNLNVNSSNQSTDIQRLSTGLRINSAADDASGLVRSQSMNGQLVGLNQATSNTNDAINLTKTAEAALNEVQNLLMSMRQLAVQASNAGVNDSATVSADQAQITSAIQSINRISSTTQFGTIKLLDGSATGATTTTNGTSSVNNNGLSVKAQGAWTSATADTFTGAAVTAATASSATAAGTAVTGAAGTLGGSVDINGTTYNLAAAGTDLAGLNTAIKASGYQATLSGGGIKFTAATTGAPTSAQAIDTTNLTTSAGSFTAAGTQTVTAGTDASLTLSGGSIGAGTFTSASSVDNGDGTATYSFSNGMVIGATSSTTAVIKDSTGAQTSTLTSVAGASSKGKDLTFQVGANSGQTTSISIASTAADQIGQGAASYKDAAGATQQVWTGSVKDIDVSSFKGAQDAIAVIDKAISDVSTIRASLGAFQTNVLQSNANSLSVSQQNLSASKSSITDADLAATVVQYTKDQILVQSSTSALSYANQQPQSILKLLQ